MLFIEEEDLSADRCDNCQFWIRGGVIKGKCNCEDSLWFRSKTYDDDHCDEHVRQVE